MTTTHKTSTTGNKNTKVKNLAPISGDVRAKMIDEAKAKKDAAPPQPAQVTEAVRDKTGAPVPAALREKRKQDAWVDLAADLALGQKRPTREKTIPFVLIAMTEREGGATLEEIAEAYKAIEHQDHDPKAGLRFLHNMRGFGFTMHPTTKKITLVLK